MNRPLSFTAAAVIAMAWLPFASPAHADEHEIPADCEVPPDLLPPGTNIIIGTDDSETLRGTPGVDYICGRLGDDRIIGYGGGDFIAGDTTTFFGDKDAPGGDDVIIAGPGDDEVLPGPGDDRVNGGPGDDFLALAVGDDVGIGGPGDDGIIGGFGRDLASGGPGNDEVAGGPDDDLVLGGPGDDALFGGIPGGGGAPPGRDRCIGASGTDTAVECAIARGVEGP